MLANLKRKNFSSTIPLSDALNFLILALKDSVAAQDILVLTLKGVCIDMVIIVKRTAGHRGCVHTSLLKKPRNS